MADLLKESLRREGYGRRVGAGRRVAHPPARDGGELAPLAYFSLGRRHTNALEFKRD